MFKTVRDYLWALCNGTPEKGIRRILPIRKEVIGGTLEKNERTVSRYLEMILRILLLKSVL